MYDFSDWEKKGIAIRDIGPFEPPFEKALTRIGEGWNCIDVGAAIGYYTVKMGRLVGEKGKIWAIEPHPIICSVLKRNIRLHNLKNAVVLQMAVDKEKRRVHLFETWRRGGTYTRPMNPQPVEIALTGIWLEYILEGKILHLIRRLAQKGKVEEALSVEADRLDNIVAKRIDLIKLDIQGMEFDALKGAKRILERDKPILLVEIHPSPYWRPEQLFKLIRRYGYEFSVEKINGRPDTFLVGE